MIVAFHACSKNYQFIHDIINTDPCQCILLDDVMEQAGSSMMECRQYTPDQNDGTGNHIAADKLGDYCEGCDHGMSTVAPNTAVRHDEVYKQ